MRGADTFTEKLFTMRKLEDFIPAEHPLRAVRKMANTALEKMNGLFADMYASDVKGGRPSIAPEKLLRAMLLQVLYSVRSERQLMEQVQYNLLLRWFIGLSMDDAVWVPTVFTKNRERLIGHDAVVEFFNEVLAIAEEKDWLSGGHFSVDGTLIQAWAGLGTRVSCARTMTRITVVAVTSKATSAATTPTTPRPIRTRACTARAATPAVNYATSATRSATTVTA